MQEIILNRLESNCFGPNSIPVYGGLYHLYNNGEPSLDAIVAAILRAVDDAKFFEPTTPSNVVVRNACALLLIDPMLIQIYMGVSSW